MTQSGELAREQRQELPGAKSSALSLPPATSDVTSFRVQVPQRAVRDLQRRIRNARWPEKELAPDWSQGVPLSDARDFVEYWASRYDWRRLEAEINSFGNYRTRLDGVGIHFIHAESPHANALPLILKSLMECYPCGPVRSPSDRRRDGSRPSKLPLPPDHLPSPAPIDACAQTSPQGLGPGQRGARQTIQQVTNGPTRSRSGVARWPQAQQGGGKFS
jgi:hypothetical protein